MIGLNSMGLGGEEDFVESHAAVQHAQNKLSYQQPDLEGKQGVLKKAEWR